MTTKVRYGVGGWTYAPWRGVFFPEGLPQKEELAYASAQLTTIEINGTFYRSQKPATFAKWREQTPAGFMFAVKAPRYATHRKKLGEAGPTVERFLQGGIGELKEKLGPINWQLMPSTKFDPAELEAFLKLLPTTVGRQRLRHAIEVRHESFRSPEFVALARRYQVAIITAGDSKYPQIADVTADFVYLRIMGTSPAHATGYAPAEISRWARRARTYHSGATPEDLDVIAPVSPAQPLGRDVFLYVISGHKELNPAAAQALLAQHDGKPVAAASAPKRAARKKPTRQ